MGSNTSEAHPIIANRMKKAAKKGLKIYVIDPRQIDMTKFATKHLPLYVGSDIALMNAMIHTILKNGWFDKTFLENNTTDIETLREQVSLYTPAYASSVTGLSEDDIIEVAEAFAKADKGMIAYTLGITEHHCGVNNVFDIANLSLITGNIGKRGTGIMPLRGQNNVQGAGDMGCLPNMLTGAVPISDDQHRNRFEKAWAVSLNKHVGQTQTVMLEKMNEGRMKGLYIIGENPVLADVHMSYTKEALENVDFMVVQDLFMTETAKMADVVLPAKGWAEVEGTYTNTDRRVQRVRAALDAHENLKDDWEILTDIANLMGYPMSYESSEEIWHEVRELAQTMYGGMSYERLSETNGLQYPCPDNDHPGTEILHTRFQENKKLDHPSPFIGVSYTPPVEQPDENYPFTLTTGRRYEQYNTHTQTKYYPDQVKQKQTEETVDMHPEDAKELEITDGEYVQVRSRRGKVTVKAKVTEQVQPKLVFMSFHWADVPTNKLTIDEFDPISGTAEFKACAVAIEKID
ncbi:putative molibdopterin-dependent oxidoreductase YjgC [Texcoconibacillus texcoconensis]|uniref:Putative molibdopterin-dependent oxidoreductase YjgC n=3 Tax=Texcoconibacillus texcoconensis TaxID=1095777 RepID=A0A840QQI9_9BACI|nr:putative molibdopterin-dependent oxidoreductase YjgC [Texcoconibacillus texcoconensis]